MLFFYPLLLVVLCGTGKTVLSRKRVPIPAKGYRDLRDTLHNQCSPDLWQEWSGNECPFQDALHHNRYNLEELMLPHHQLVPETLDRLRLAQAEKGEQYGGAEASLWEAAERQVIPYSTNPLEEKRIVSRMRELRIYDE
jgi:hypothetical protein